MRNKVPRAPNPNNLTCQVWVLMGPPAPGPEKYARPRTTSIRDVLNALMYRVSTAFFAKGFSAVSGG
jgi:hypothetical protein